MKNKYKIMFLYLLLILIIFLLLFYSLLQHPTISVNKITYNQFLQDVQDGKIKSVVIQQQKIIACHSKNKCFETIMPTEGNHLLNTLTKNEVKINAQPPSSSFMSLIEAWWLNLLLYVAIIILFFLTLIGLVNFIKSHRNK